MTVVKKMDYLKLGLDIGNSTIKAIGIINEGLIKYSIKALATHDASDNNAIVKMSDNKNALYFGVGKPLVTIDKTKREFVSETILLAIAKVYGPIANERTIHVGIGLPLGDYKNNAKKDRYQEEMNTITSLNGYVDDIDYNIEIKITVYAEGFSAFYYLMPEIDKMKRWIFADHGYRTSDILGVSYENGKWKVDDYLPVEHGLMHMYTGIAKYLSNETCSNTLPPEDVEYYLRNSPVLELESGDYDINNYTKGAEEEIRYIYNTAINNAFPDLDMRKIFLLGGNAKLVKKHLERRNVILDEDSQKLFYANAMGYYLQLK